MAIPESQLDTWSHQGSIAQSSSTYNTIKAVLESAKTPYAMKAFSVFLQGSYGNDTNIYAESDVDIVIRLDDCWHSDQSQLTPVEKAAYSQSFEDAKYTHADFKRDVLKVLSDAYGADVKAGDKAIAISPGGNRRKADVIVAVQYRRYHRFVTKSDQSFDQGICFYNRAGDQIANYPKQHSANLTARHQTSNEWLKPSVRVLKNLRGKLVEDNRIKPGIAPSYYLEGLLYNVPTDRFNTSYGDCFVNSVNWLRKEADTSKLLCANEQYYLLWDDSPTSWAKEHYEAFLDAAIALWNEW